MKSKQIVQCGLVAFLFAASSALNASSEDKSVRVEVPRVNNMQEIRFGALSQRADGITQLQETAVVNRRNSNGYGWIALFAPGGTPKEWREVLELPQAPTSEPVRVANIEYQEKGRIAIRKGLISVEDAGLTQFWSLDDSDPAGKYKLRIYFDSALVKEVDFTVVD